MPTPKESTHPRLVELPSRILLKKDSLHMAMKAGSFMRAGRTIHHWIGSIGTDTNSQMLRIMKPPTHIFSEHRILIRKWSKPAWMLKRNVNSGN